MEVPAVSMELCGGTHVTNTSEIRGFKITSEQGIASGIRRIEAVAGEAFIEYVNARDSYLSQLCTTLKVHCSKRFSVKFTNTRFFLASPNKQINTNAILLQCFINSF